MKKLKLTAFFTCLTLLIHGQFYVREYTCPVGVEETFSCRVRYHCITTMDDDLLIAGTLDGSNRTIILVVINEQGDINATYNIPVFDETTTNPILDATFIPTGVLYENNPTSKMAIVCGYVGTDPDHSQGFVLKYNLLTSNIVWSKIVDAPIYDNTTGDRKYSLFLDIKFAEDRNYYVCGEEFTGNSLIEDAIIYKVSKPSGILTKISNFHTLDPNTIDPLTDPSSDTYYSMTVTGDDIVTSGRSELYDGNLAAMRPTIVSTDITGIVNYSKFYVRSSATAARLYGLDIAPAGNDYISIVTGDMGGTQVNRDLFVVKTNSVGNLIWQKRLSYAAPNDGQLSSIETYQTANGYKSIIYGNKSGSPGNVYIIGLDESGLLVFSKEIPAVFMASTLGPNTMVIKNNKIFAVGYRPSSPVIEYGVVICANLSDGTISPECAIDYIPSVMGGVATQFPLTPVDPATQLSILPLSVTKSNVSLLPDYICAYNTFKSEQAGIDNTIIIYNSGNNLITFDLNTESDEIFAIEVFNTLGETVYSDNFSNSQINIKLESGIYFYRLTSSTDQGLIRRATGEFFVN